jgi:hypothetical protein
VSVAARMKKYRAKKAARRALARALDLGVTPDELREMILHPRAQPERNADRRYVGTRGRRGRVTLRPVTPEDGE